MDMTNWIDPSGYWQLEGEFITSREENNDETCNQIKIRKTAFARYLAKEFVKIQERDKRQDLLDPLIAAFIKTVKRLKKRTRLYRKQGGTSIFDKTLFWYVKNSLLTSVLVEYARIDELIQNIGVEEKQAFSDWAKTKILGYWEDLDKDESQ